MISTDSVTSSGSPGPFEKKMPSKGAKASRLAYSNGFSFQGKRVTFRPRFRKDLRMLSFIPVSIIAMCFFALPEVGS